MTYSIRSNKTATQHTRQGEKEAKYTCRGEKEAKYTCSGKRGGCVRDLAARLSVQRLERCGEMWGDVGRCGEMWRDVARCGEMWGDVGRCGEMTTDHAEAPAASAVGAPVDIVYSGRLLAPLEGIVAVPDMWHQGK